MESAEQNRLLTEVGRGTPMGELMRRYWQPIGAAVELEDQLDEAGAPARRGPGAVSRPPRRTRADRRAVPAPARLVLPRHPDRAAASAARTTAGNSTPRANASRSRSRRTTAPFANEVGTDAYPVQELGGVLFAYLGPKRPSTRCRCCRASTASSPRARSASWVARCCRSTGCRSWRTRSTRCTPSGCTGTSTSSKRRRKASRSRSARRTRRSTSASSSTASPSTACSKATARSRTTGRSAIRSSSRTRWRSATAT